ncbi:AMP-binding protein [Flavonifractor sp. An9]|uniref:AMP-binding protein n=1 Tax=Flavonifractor sp. An9 TaxID=1965664 RepID=UPI000B37FA3E|nr:AMP-binding protein [Flavonifractor sp. An9]OUN11574.1 hypothetical protein B5G40_06475 [Flavonifractor sp. An9]
MLLERIEAHSAALGDRPALMAGEEMVRWGELWPMAQGLAAKLREQGTGPVALVGDPGEVWVPVAFVACLLAGRPYLPLDPLLPPAGQRELLEQAGAALLDRRTAEEGFSSGLSCPLPDDSHRIAYEIFTSGSTGKPKLVEVSLGNLEHFLRWASALPEIAPVLGGTAVGQAAWSFDLSVADLYLSLLGGGTHVALTGAEKEDFAALFRRLEKSDLSLLVATPSFLRLCLTEPSFGPDRLPRLRTVFSCGEVLPPAAARRLLDRFPGVALLNAYGPTEATCAVCAVPISREMCAGPLPIGTVGAGAVDIFLENGEIVLAGASVSPRFGGKYSTGDLGYVENGLLYWAGRRDLQLKYKGYRLEPTRIEGALEALPQVERAAVIPRRDGAGQVKGLTAFVEGTGLEPEKLAQALADLLPPYQIPGQWRVLDRLPLTPNGKCDRKRLEEML